MIARVFDQAAQRDPTGRRTWVVLVDGARHQLDLIQTEAARRGVTIHILVDFVHILEYVWKAAWCFYQDADPAAEPWVAAHALKLLAGDVGHVIHALGQQATDAGLTAGQRSGVDACIGYLTAKRTFLGYDTALTRGWPIATGVIEGACRHLIGDRLDSPAPAGAWRAPGRPQAPRPVQQRRLRRLLALPHTPRAPTRPSGPLPAATRPCGLISQSLRRARLLHPGPLRGRCGW